MPGDNNSVTWFIRNNASNTSSLGLAGGTIVNQVPYIGVNLSDTPGTVLCNSYTEFDTWQNYYLYLQTVDSTWYTIVFTPVFTGSSAESNRLAMLSNGFKNAIPVSAPDTVVNLLDSVSSTSSWYSISLNTDAACFYPVVRKNELGNLGFFPVTSGVLCGFIPASDSFHWLNNFTFGTTNATAALAVPVESTLYCFREGYSGIYGSNAAYLNGVATSNTSNLDYYNRGFNISYATLTANGTVYYYGQTTYGSTTSTDPVIQLYSSIVDPTGGAYRFAEIAYRAVVLMNQVSTRNNVDKIFVYDLVNQVRFSQHELKMFTITSQDQTPVEFSDTFVKNLTDVHQVLGMFNEHNTLIMTDPASTTSGYIIGESQDHVHWWSGPYRSYNRDLGDVYETSDYSYSMMYTAMQCQYCFATKDYVTGSAPVFNWGVTGASYARGERGYAFYVSIQNPVKFYWSYPKTQLSDNDFDEYYGTVTSSFLVFNGIESIKTLYADQCTTSYFNDPNDGNTKFVTDTLCFYNVGTNPGYTMVADSISCNLYLSGIPGYTSQDYNSDTRILYNSIDVRYNYRWTTGTITIGDTAETAVTYESDVNDRVYVCDNMFPMMITRLIAQHYYNANPSSFKRPYVSDFHHTGYNTWSTTIKCDNPFTIRAVSAPGNNPIIGAITGLPVTTTSLTIEYSLIQGTSTYTLLFYETMVNDTPVQLVNKVIVNNVYSYINLVDAFKFPQLCDTRADYSSADKLTLVSASSSASAVSLVFNSGCNLVYSLSQNPGLFKYTSLTGAEFGHDAAYTTSLFQANYLDIAHSGLDTMNTSVMFVNPSWRGLWLNNKYVPVWNGSTWVEESMYRSHANTVNAYNGYLCFIKHQSCLRIMSTPWSLSYKFDGVADPVTVATPFQDGYFTMEQCIQMFIRSMSMGLLSNYGAAQCDTLGFNFSYSSDLLNQSKIIDYPFVNTSITMGQANSNTASIRFGYLPFIGKPYPYYFFNAHQPAKYYNDYNSNWTSIKGYYLGSFELGDETRYGGYMYLTTDKTDINALYRLFVPVYAIGRPGIMDMTIDYLLQGSNAAMVRANGNTVGDLVITGATSTSSSVKYLFNKNVEVVYSVPTTAITDTTIANLFTTNVFEHSCTVSFDPSLSSYTRTYVFPGLEQSIIANTSSGNDLYINQYHVYTVDYNDALPVSRDVTVYCDPGFGYFNANRVYIPKFNSNSTILDSDATRAVSTNPYLYYEYNLNNASPPLPRFTLDSTCNTMCLVIDTVSTQFSIPVGTYSFYEFIDVVRDTIGSAIGYTKTVYELDYVQFVGTKEWYFDRSNAQSTIHNYFWTRYYNLCTTVQSPLLELSTMTIDSDYCANDSFFNDAKFVAIQDTETKLTDINTRYYQPTTIIQYVIKNGTNPTDQSKIREGHLIFDGRVTTIVNFTEILGYFLNYVYSDIVPNFLGITTTQASCQRPYRCLRPYDYNTTTMTLSFDSNFKLCESHTSWKSEWTFHADSRPDLYTLLKNIQIVDYNFTRSVTCTVNYTLSGTTSELVCVIPAACYINDEIFIKAFQTAFDTAYGSSVTDYFDDQLGPHMNTENIEMKINSITTDYPETLFYLLQSLNYTDVYPVGVTNRVYTELPIAAPVHKWDTTVATPIDTQTTTIVGNGLLNKIVQAAYQSNVSVTSWVVSNGGIDITMAKNIVVTFANSSGATITPCWSSKIITQSTATGNNHITFPDTVYKQYRNESTITVSGTTPVTLTLAKQSFTTQQETIDALNNLFATNSVPLSWTPGETGYTLKLNGYTLGGTFWNLDFFGISDKITTSTEYTWIYATSLNGATVLTNCLYCAATIPEFDRYLCLVNSNSYTVSTSMALADNTTFDVQTRVRYNAYKIMDLVACYTRQQSYALFRAGRSTFANGWYLLNQVNYTDHATWTISSNVAWNSLKITGDSTTSTLLKQVPFNGYTEPATVVATLSNSYAIYPQSSNYYMYIKNQLNEYYTVFFIPTSFESTQEANNLVIIGNAFREAVPVTSPSSRENLFVSVESNSAMYTISLNTVIGCYYPAAQSNNPALILNFPAQVGTLCGFIGYTDTHSYLNNFTYGTVNSSNPLTAWVSSVQYCLRSMYQGVYGSNAAYCNQEINSDPNNNGGVTNLRYFNLGLNISRVTMGGLNWYLNQRNYFSVSDDNIIYPMFSDPTRGAWRFNELNYRCLVLINKMFKNAGVDRIILCDFPSTNNNFDLVYTDSTYITGHKGYYKKIPRADFSDPYRCLTTFFQHTNSQWCVLNNITHEMPINNTYGYLIGESSTGTKWWSGPVNDFSMIDNGRGYDKENLIYNLAQAQVCFPITGYTPGTASNFNWGITGYSYSYNNSTTLNITNNFRLYWSYPSVSDSGVISDYYGTTTSNWLLFNGIEKTSRYNTYLHIPILENTVFFDGSIRFYENPADGKWVMNYSTKQCELYNESTMPIDKINNDTIAIAETSGNHLVTQLYFKWYNGSLNVANATSAYPFNKYWLSSQAFLGALGRTIAKPYYDSSPSTFKLVYTSTFSHISYNSWSVTLACSTNFNIRSKTVTSGNLIVASLQTGTTTSSTSVTWSAWSGTNSYFFIHYKTMVNSVLTPLISYSPIKSRWIYTNIIDSLTFNRVSDTRAECSNADTLTLVSGTKTASAFEFVFDSSVLPIYSSSRVPGSFRYCDIPKADYGSGCDKGQNIDTMNYFLYNQNFIDIADIDNNTEYESSLTVFNDKYRFTIDKDRKFEAINCNNNFLVNDIQMWNTDITSNSDCFYNGNRGFYLKLQNGYNVRYRFYNGQSGQTDYVLNNADQRPGYYDSKSLLEMHARIYMLGPLRGLGSTVCYNQGFTVTSSSDLLRTSDIPDYPLCKTSFTFAQNTANTLTLRKQSSNPNAVLRGGCAPISYFSETNTPSKYFSDYGSSFNDIRGTFCTWNDRYTNDCYMYFTTSNTDRTKYYRMYLPLNGLYSTDPHKNLCIPCLAEAGKQAIHKAHDSTIVTGSELQITSVTSTSSSVSYIFNRNVVPVFSIPTTGTTDTNMASMFVNNVITKDLTVTFPEQTSYTETKGITGVEQTQNRYNKTSSVYHIYAEDYTSATPVTNTITVYVTPRFGIFDSTLQHNFVPLFESNSAIVPGVDITKSDTNEYLYTYTSSSSSVTESTLRYALTPDNNTMVVTIGNSDNTIVLPCGNYSWDSFVTLISTQLQPLIGTVTIDSTPSDYIVFTGATVSDWYFNRASTLNTVQNYYWAKTYCTNAQVQNKWLLKVEPGILDSGYTGDEPFYIENNLFGTIVDTESKVEPDTFYYYQESTNITYSITDPSTSTNINGYVTVPEQSMTANQLTYRIAELLNDVCDTSFGIRPFGGGGMYNHYSTMGAWVKDVVYSLTFDSKMQFATVSHQFVPSGQSEVKHEYQYRSGWYNYTASTLVLESKFLAPVNVTVVTNATTGSFTIAAGDYTEQQLLNQFKTGIDTIVGSEVCTVGLDIARYILTTSENTVITALNYMYPQQIMEFTQVENHSVLKVHPHYPRRYYPLNEYDNSGYQQLVHRWDPSVPVPTGQQKATITGIGLLNKVVQMAYLSGIGVNNWEQSAYNGLKITMNKNIDFSYRLGDNTDTVFTPGFTSVINAATGAAKGAKDILIPGTVQATYTGSSTLILNGTTTYTISAGIRTIQDLVAYVNTLLPSDYQFTQGYTGYTMRCNGTTVSGTLAFKYNTVYDIVELGYTSVNNNVPIVEIPNHVTDEDRYICLVNSNASTFVTDIVTKANTVANVSNTITYGVYKIQDLVPTFTRYQSYTLYTKDTTNVKNDKAWYNLSQTGTATSFTWSITGSTSWPKLSIATGNGLYQVPFINGYTSDTPATTVSNDSILSAKYDQYYVYLKDTSSTHYTVTFTPVVTGTTHESNVLAMFETGFRNAKTVSNVTTNLYTSVTGDSIKYTLGLSKSLGMFYPVVHKNSLVALSNFPEQNSGTLCGFISSTVYAFRFLNNFTFGTIDTNNQLATTIGTTQYCLRDGYAGVYGSTAAYLNANSSSSAVEHMYFNRGFNISRAKVNNTWFYYNQRVYKGTTSTEPSVTRYASLVDITGGAYRYLELAYRSIVWMNLKAKSVGDTERFVYETSSSKWLQLYKTSGSKTTSARYTSIDSINFTDPYQVHNSFTPDAGTYVFQEPMLSEGGYFISEDSNHRHMWSGPLYNVDTVTGTSGSDTRDYEYRWKYTMLQCQFCFATKGYTPGDASIYNWGVTDVKYTHGEAGTWDRWNIRTEITNPTRFFWSYPRIQLTNAQFEDYYGTITSNWLVCHGIETVERLGTTNSTREACTGVYLNLPIEESNVNNFNTTSIVMYNWFDDNLGRTFILNNDEHKLFITDFYNPYIMETINNDTIAVIESSSDLTPKYYTRWYNGTMTVNGVSVKAIATPYFVRDSLFPMMISRAIAQVYGTSDRTYVSNFSRSGQNWTTTIKRTNNFTISAKSAPSGNAVVNAMTVPVTTNTLTINYGLWSGNSTFALVYYRTTVNSVLQPVIAYTQVTDNFSVTNVLDAFKQLQVCDTRYTGAAIPTVTGISNTNDTFSFTFNSNVYLIYSLSRSPGLFANLNLTNASYGHDAAYSTNLFQANYKDIAAVYNSNPATNSLMFVTPSYRGSWDIVENQYIKVWDGSSVVEPSFRSIANLSFANSNGTMCFVNHQSCNYFKQGATWKLGYKITQPGQTTATQIDNVVTSLECGILTIEHTLQMMARSLSIGLLNNIGPAMCSTMGITIGYDSDMLSGKKIQNFPFVNSSLIINQTTANSVLAKLSGFGDNFIMQFDNVALQRPSYYFNNYSSNFNQLKGVYAHEGYNTSHEDLSGGYIYFTTDPTNIDNIYRLYVPVLKIYNNVTTYDLSLELLLQASNSVLVRVNGNTAVTDANEISITGVTSTSSSVSYIFNKNVQVIHSVPTEPIYDTALGNLMATNMIEHNETIGYTPSSLDSWTRTYNFGDLEQCMSMNTESNYGQYSVYHVYSEDIQCAVPRLNSFTVYVDPGFGTFNPSTREYTPRFNSNSGNLNTSITAPCTTINNYLYYDKTEPTVSKVKYQLTTSYNSIVVHTTSDLVLRIPAGTYSFEEFIQMVKVTLKDTIGLTNVAWYSDRIEFTGTNTTWYFNRSHASNTIQGYYWSNNYKTATTGQTKWLSNNILNGATGTAVSEPVSEIDKYLCLVNSNCNYFSTVVTKSDNSTSIITGRVRNNVYTPRELMKYYTRLNTYKLYRESRSTFNKGWYLYNHLNYTSAQQWTISGNASYNKILINGPATTYTLLQQLPFTGYTVPSASVASTSNRYTITPVSNDYYMYIKDTVNNLFYTVFFVPSPLVTTPTDSDSMKILATGFRDAQLVKDPGTPVNLFKSITSDSTKFTISLNQTIGCYYPIIYKGSLSNLDNFPVQAGSQCGFINATNTNYHFLNHFTFGTIDIDSYNVATYINSIHYCFRDPYEGIFGSNAAYYNGEPTTSADQLLYFNRGYNIKRVRMRTTNATTYANFYYNQYVYKGTSSTDATDKLYSFINDQSRGAYRFDELGMRMFVLMNNVSYANNINRTFVIDIWHNTTHSPDYFINTYFTTDKTSVTAYRTNSIVDTSNVYQLINNYDTEGSTYWLTEPRLSNGGYLMGITNTGVHWWSGPFYNMMSDHNSRPDLKYALAMKYIFTQCQYCFATSNYTQGNNPLFKWNITNVTYDNYGSNSDSLKVVMNPDSAFKLIWSYPKTQLTDQEFTDYYGTLTSTWLVLHGIETVGRIGTTNVLKRTATGVYLNDPKTEDTANNWVPKSATSMYFMDWPDDTYYFIADIDSHKLHNGRTYNPYFKTSVNGDTLTVVESSSSLVTKTYLRWFNGNVTVNNTIVNNVKCPYFVRDSEFATMIARCVASVQSPVRPYVTDFANTSYNHWTVTIKSDTIFTINSKTVTSGNPMVSAIVDNTTTDTLILNYTLYSGTERYVLFKYNTVVNDTVTSTVNKMPLVDTWDVTNLIMGLNSVTSCDTRYPSAPTLQATSVTSSASGINVVFNSAVAPVYSLSVDPRLFKDLTLVNNEYGKCAAYGTNWYQAHYQDIALATNLDSAVTFVSPSYRGTWDFVDESLESDYIMVYDSNGKQVEPEYHTHDNGTITGWTCFIRHQSCNWIQSSNWSISAKVNDTEYDSVNAPIDKGFHLVKHVIQTLCRCMSYSFLVTIGPTQCDNLGISFSYDSDMLHTDIPNYPFVNTSILVNQTTPDTALIKLTKLPFHAGNGNTTAYQWHYLVQSHPRYYLENYCSNFSNIAGFYLCASLNGSNYDTGEMGGYIYFTTDTHDINRVYRLFISGVSSYNATDEIRSMPIDYLLYASNQAMIRVNGITPVTDSNELCITGATSTSSSVTYIFNKPVQAIHSVPISAITDPAIATMFSTSAIETVYTKSFPGLDTYTQSFNFPDIEHTMDILSNQNPGAWNRAVYHVYTQDYNSATPESKNLTVYVDIGYGVFNANKEYVKISNSNSAIVDPTNTKDCTSLNPYLYYNSLDTESNTVKYPLTSDFNTLVVNVNNADTVLTVPTGNYSFYAFIQALRDTLRPVIGSMDTIDLDDSIVFVSSTQWYFNRNHDSSTLHGYYWTRYYNTATNETNCIPKPEME